MEVDGDYLIDLFTQQVEGRTDDKTKQEQIYSTSKRSRSRLLKHSNKSKSTKRWIVAFIAVMVVIMVLRFSSPLSPYEKRL